MRHLLHHNHWRYQWHHHRHHFHRGGCCFLPGCGMFLLIPLALVFLAAFVRF